MSILEPLAAYAGSFTGTTSPIPYLIFAGIWESAYIAGLLAVYVIQRAYKRFKYAKKNDTTTGERES